MKFNKYTQDYANMMQYNLYLENRKRIGTASFIGKHYHISPFCSSA